MYNECIYTYKHYKVICMQRTFFGRESEICIILLCILRNEGINFEDVVSK